MRNTFTYLPDDTFSVEQVEKEINALMNEDSTPIFEARLSVEAAPGHEPEAIETALGALGRMMPPLSAAWWRTWGGVSVEISQPGIGRAVNSLELTPH